jgi:hypothetical protein
MATKAVGPRCEVATPLRNRATSVDFMRRKACHTPLERLAGDTGERPRILSGNVQLVSKFESTSLDEVVEVGVDVELDRRVS